MIRRTDMKTRSRRVIGSVAVMALSGAAILVASPTRSALASVQPAQLSGPARTMIVILRVQNHGLGARSLARAAAVRSEQQPILASLRSSGARDISSLSVINALIAEMSPAKVRALAASPAVAQVVPDTVVEGPAPQLRPTLTIPTGRASTEPPTSPPCGTPTDPELDPEALTNINATPSQLGTVDGAGVTVAFLADGLDTADRDFLRNPAYGTAGSRVITELDFSGDGTDAPTAGGEAFGDASSIAAQGNEVYDLSNYVSPANPLPGVCDIKLVGVAPGSDVESLKVFAQNNETTVSGIIQAINYAVKSGAKVINESFGSNQFPDTTLDVVRDADDAAVAAGVTVVVGSGDGGITSTIGSPASDPDVISVGASTTFRAYEQDAFGGINAPSHVGPWVDNNISSLSSGGFTQAGNTVDLVAPGDLNWATCSANVADYSDCTNDQGKASPVELFGGTSEAAPLTAGAAADVIQAYASTHGGTDPSPALVKQILMSTATDIDAPATEQGAGLLNVLAAVKEAESISGTTGTPQGGLLVSPNQIDIVQHPGASTTEAVHVTNTGSSPVTVGLTTRALTKRVFDQSGSFCMQVGLATAGCPANTGRFLIWSGVTEVYQKQIFTVPPTTGVSRLKFAADYQYTGQSSLLHFALLEPNGSYAAYSLPQGLGDYGEVEVANPPPGTWTAVFFTEKDGETPDGIGTSGRVQWNAGTFEYAPAGLISPDSVVIGAGSTATAHVTFTSPASAGDSDQSVVLSTATGATTIPVTLRTSVPITSSGGTFSGVLTGGNGRGGTEAQTNTYFFDVPSGKAELDVSVALATDPEEPLLVFLVDPNGQTVGYSTDYTTTDMGTPESTRFANVYHVAPTAGQWRVVLQWLNPVSGLELNEPFTGAIRFDRVKATTSLPNSRSTELKKGRTYRFDVSVENPGRAPEVFFVDPRLDHSETITLSDQNVPGTASDLILPLPPGVFFPYYLVPSHTTELEATVTGSVPVTFDLEYFPGDPDVSPAVSAPDVSGSSTKHSARLTLREPEISPGLWSLNPSEIGPYPWDGARNATASASLSATTQAFDPTIVSSTGDVWSAANGLTNSFSFTPVYVPPGGRTNIALDLTPEAPKNTVVSGTLYVCDYTLASSYGGDLFLANADDLAAIPYSYKVTG